MYNKVQTDERFPETCNNVLKNVDHDSVSKFSMVNETVIEKALKMLKSRKSDSVFDMSSDFYHHRPPELTTHLTNMIRLFLSHGFVPEIVILCTLLPLVKDALGDITQSDNYRAIAGGCLVLKIIDIVVLIIEGDKLSFDCLQFAYHQHSGTVMCTWTATAVIDYFTRSGNPVYSAAMDMSKAFDLVKWTH